MLCLVGCTHVLADNMPLLLRVGVLHGGESMMEVLQMLAAADNRSELVCCAVTLSSQQQMLQLHLRSKPCSAVL
jgi:hypothetical protein